MEDGKVLLPIVSNKRECGDCTKCCEGAIPGQAYDYKFGQNVPCFFVESGLGCTIYEDRPVHACQTFKCQWLTDINIPEEYKPNKVDFITLKKGRSYFLLIPAGDNPSEEYVEFMKNYISENNFNLSYRYNLNDEPMFIGSDRLKQTLAYSQKDHEPNAIDRDIRLEQKRLAKLEEQ